MANVIAYKTYFCIQHMYGLLWIRMYVSPINVIFKGTIKKNNNNEIPHTVTHLAEEAVAPTGKLQPHRVTHFTSNTLRDKMEAYTSNITIPNPQSRYQCDTYV